MAIQRLISLASVGVMAVSLAVASVEGQGPSRGALEKAYSQAQRCFSATTSVKDRPGAKVSYDAIMKLGRALGYDSARLNSDADGGVDLVRMARDRPYLNQVLSDCQRLGLATSAS